MSAQDIDLNVPVIDLSTPAEPEDLKQHDAELSRQVGEACREWGFFQVTGHGVPKVMSDATFNSAQQFFTQPTAIKRQILRSAENPWGFFDAELTKNTPDWKEIVDIGPTRDAQQPQWPNHPVEFRSAIEAYAKQADALARRLTAIVLQTLGDETGAELAGFSEHTSFLRLNQYPVCPNPAAADTPHTQSPNAAGLAIDRGHLGISHHTDAGALTVLQQWGPAGLQVLHKERWHTVEVVKDALVINIGDVVQVWSNDRYPAPLHRVLANASVVRCSAAYFFNPDFSYTYAPLPNTGPPVYHPINWGEFRAGRAAGDYADIGEEIQISQYRTTS